jgi:hypothetical protein
LGRAERIEEEIWDESEIGTRTTNEGNRCHDEKERNRGERDVGRERHMRKFS